MNNKFLTATLLFAVVLVTPVFASTSVYNKYAKTNRVINPGTPVKKIVITGDVDIVLTMDGTSDISIDGKPGISQGIKLVYQENKLEVIASGRGSKKKHVVRIPVQQLQSIEINGDGKIYSESYIASANLEIFINGACNVSIRSTGNISVKTSPEYEITYAKNGIVTTIPDFY